MTARPASGSGPSNLRSTIVAMVTIILVVWTVFPIVWVLLTSLKAPDDIISVPSKIVFPPTIDNFMALLFGEQRGSYSTARPDFPMFFLNSVIIVDGVSARG